MKNIKKYKALISVALIIIFISVIACVLNRNVPHNHEMSKVDKSMVMSDVSEKAQTQKNVDDEKQNVETEENKTVSAESDTESTTEEKVYESEEEVDETSDKEQTCTLSVRCDTILKNIVSLDSEKTELVPKDGIVYAEKTVTFNEGESVFDLLVREMNYNKIHLEFVETPIYKSAYIEGIANIYEFDCGELSGWMYKVNGWFPNYGCSQYQLKQGDKVEWIYTCDLGRDIGGEYSARNGR